MYSFSSSDCLLIVPLGQKLQIENALKTDGGGRWPTLKGMDIEVVAIDSLEEDVDDWGTADVLKRLLGKLKAKANGTNKGIS